MESVLVYALYVWVAVSLIALAVQLVRWVRYRRRVRARAVQSLAPVVKPRATPDVDLREPPIDLTAEETEPASDEAVEPTDESATATDADPGAGAPTDGTTPVPPAPNRRIVISAPTATSGTDTTASTLVDATTNGALAADPTTTTDTTVDDAAPADTSDADTDPTPTTPLGVPATVSAPGAAAAVTVADVLRGVRLPRGLVPISDRARPPADDRVTLIAHDGAPADVGVDLADELERLGFEIRPEGEDAATAHRGDHAVRLRIIPDAHGAEHHGDRRFPDAPESSVAVEVDVID